MDIIVKPPNIPSVILDATMLSTIMSCSRLADFRFNHDFRPASGKSKSLEMGSIVHTYLEYFFNARIKGLSQSDAIKYGMAAAETYSRSDEVTTSTQDDIALALNTCELYAEHYKNDHWVPLEVETVKGKILYQDDEIRIMWKAKFDLLADTNSGIFPVDHKTMTQRRDTVSLNNQFIGQCILANTRVMYVNKIGFQKSLKPAERFARVPVSYSFERLMEWQDTILPYWAKRWLMESEEGYYPPNFTHCENKYGFCQFRHVCEADRNIREEALRAEFVVGEKWQI